MRDLSSRHAAARPQRPYQAIHAAVARRFLLLQKSAAEMAFEAAKVILDDRRDYGEPRYSAIGPIGERLHVLAVTLRGGTLRAISLRRANARDRQRHERP